LLFSRDSFGAETFARLHPSAIEGQPEIRALIEHLRREKVLLRRGLNRRLTPETARIESVDRDRFALRTFDFEPKKQNEVWLNFDLERPYFFVASVVAAKADRLTATLPTTIYRAERRDRTRITDGDDPSVSRRVRLRSTGSEAIDGHISDFSPSGIGVNIPGGCRIPAGSTVAIEFLDGHQAGTILHAKLCHERFDADHDWHLVGLSLLDASPNAVAITQPAGPGFSWRSAQRTWEAVAAGAVAQSERIVRAVTRRSRPLPQVHVLDFVNERDEQIRALVNWAGVAPSPGAPAVIIPPAWGRTKETLLPLAVTLVSAFERLGQPITVVRFDGVRKRGESFNDPECRRAGAEHHRFTFSQGVDDIRTIVDGLDRMPEFAPGRIALVTFSAASVDGRRAVALDNGRRIAGWVSVVGSADLQSMMRVISGGIDYLGGVERGVSFGLQEILGVEVDIDLAAADALAHRLGFLEDSCRDMDSIRVPVTWIHGRHDAWMDLDRARVMLSRGMSANRKLVIVPTGHQLRTSKEALEVFQLVASEVGRLCLGRSVKPPLPRMVELDERRQAERRRLPVPKVDKKAFWRTYLLGRDGSLGIELMTSATSFRRFMTEQVVSLDLKDGDHVVDLGSGTGSFLSSLSENPASPRRLVVRELDYVTDALVRARERLAQKAPSGDLRASFIACEIGGAEAERGIPLRAESANAVLASLFINYVERPAAVFKEVWRLLKPGGRFVVSGLRRDADVSKLFIEAIDEIGRGEGAGRLNSDGKVDLERASRDFLNEATRLLDLEEMGVFEFRDASELASMLEATGFQVEKTWPSFGDPPQAVVVLARKVS
jgi:ubiquinone/menaquinone biosynthesis C-methylase UbiE/esterase/lipase